MIPLDLASVLNCYQLLYKNMNEDRTLEILYSVNWMSIARFDFPLCIGDKNKCSNFLSKLFSRIPAAFDWIIMRCNGIV